MPDHKIDKISKAATVAAVVIGRNEGDRLRDCFNSLQHHISHIIYVDSGSMDESIAIAKQAGAFVIKLELNAPFTAARARNAGFAMLMTFDNPPALVQFVDGDCS